jgi:hypothetical protein
MVAQSLPGKQFDAGRRLLIPSVQRVRTDYLAGHRRRGVEEHVVDVRQGVMNDEVKMSRGRLVMGDEVIDDRMRTGIHDIPCPWLEKPLLTVLTNSM